MSRMLAIAAILLVTACGGEADMDDEATTADPAAAVAAPADSAAAVDTAAISPDSMAGDTVSH